MIDPTLYYFHQRHMVENPEGSEHTYVRFTDYDALAARLAELERAGMPEVLRSIQTQSDLVKRLDARLAKAESALREAVDYLDYHDGLNSICADSILHRKMRAAIASATSSAGEPHG